MTSSRGIWFSVLGSIRAWIDGAEIDLGSPQQRSVLAVLLLRGGDAASVDELAHALWGGAVPRGGAGTVRTYIYRLRRVLAVSGAATIMSRGGRYSLVCDAATMDLAAFEHAVAESRRARADEDLAAARNQLRSALSLWRGEPLADVGGHYLDARRGWLEQLRSVVTEEWMEAELATGRSEELIPELTRAIATQPLRERLHELLIIGLFRAGRRDEALAAYGAVRGILLRELGVEPGPALQELHRRVLNSDPALMAGSGDRAPATRPAQLPPSGGLFLGRRLEVQQLVSRLAESGPPRVMGITGPTGVGKTTLAAHVAHQARSQFPDGQFHALLHNASGSRVGPAEILSEFLHAFGVPAERVPTTLYGRTALWRSLLADRRVLIFLDDAYDSRQVLPLLPGGQSCAVIVTSVRPLIDLPGLSSVSIGGLADAEAAELFRRLTGMGDSPEERAACSEIVTACSFHPLAIKVAAARFTARSGRPATELAEQLRCELLGFVTVDDEYDIIDNRFRSALSRLEPELAIVCRAAAIAGADPIDDSGVAAVIDISRTAAHRALEGLVAAQLLHAGAGGRYVFDGLTLASVRRIVWAAEGVAAFSEAEARWQAYRSLATSGGGTVTPMEVTRRQRTLASPTLRLA